MHLPTAVCSGFHVGSWTALHDFIWICCQTQVSNLAHMLHVVVLRLPEDFNCYSVDKYVNLFTVCTHYLEWPYDDVKRWSARLELSLRLMKLAKFGHLLRKLEVLDIIGCYRLRCITADCILLQHFICCYAASAVYCETHFYAFCIVWQLKFQWIQQGTVHLICFWNSLPLHLLSAELALVEVYCCWRCTCFAKGCGKTGLTTVTCGGVFFRLRR